jgi:YidC/Oxa1 family membrane protein insertase
MDIKRTVLWVIFSMSLLLLWDNWMRHNGKSSMFFPSATTQQSKNANAPASASAVAAPTPAVSANGAPVSANNPAVAPVKSEIITITTDVMKADIDTLGGEVRRLELLKYKEDAKHEHFYTPFLEAVGLKEKTENHKNVVLFDAGEKRIYLAQTGLINGAFPNHKSVFVAKPGKRTLDADSSVQLVLESEQNGVKLTKTFTFKKVITQSAFNILSATTAQRRLHHRCTCS